MTNNNKTGQENRIKKIEQRKRKITSQYLCVTKLTNQSLECFLMDLHSPLGNASQIHLQKF